MYNNVTQNGCPVPRRKPWDALATLPLLHAPSPAGSLPLTSQGISSGSPGCCDTSCTPCPPKQPTVYCPGFWVLCSQKPILGTDEGQKFPPQPLLSCVGSPQALQAVVTLSAHHVLQNSPQFIVQGFEFCAPKSQFSVLTKARSFLHSHSWVVLVFWAGTDSCWKTHSWPLKKVMLTLNIPRGVLWGPQRVIFLWSCRNYIS